MIFRKVEKHRRRVKAFERWGNCHQVQGKKNRSCYRCYQKKILLQVAKFCITAVRKALGRGWDFSGQLQSIVARFC